MNQWFGQELFSPSMMSQVLELSAPYMFADAFNGMISPYYSWGPFYNHPFQATLGNFYYGDVRNPEGLDLFIRATNVRSGKVKVFAGAEIGPDALLSSACLPTLFRAVKIDREAYWDGGYTGNPPLFPLFEPQYPEDILIININPLERVDVPQTPQAIQNRMNELFVTTKTVAISSVLDALKGAGQKTVEEFLRADRPNISKRSNVDLQAMFS